MLIGDTEYRLMIRHRGGWFCRINRTGDHVWFEDDDTIDEIVVIQPKRNPKARKEKGARDYQDPLQWRGTVK